MTEDNEFENSTDRPRFTNKGVSNNRVEDGSPCQEELDVRVENFCIRPHQIGEEQAEVGVSMKMGSPTETYYLSAHVVYADGEARHQVSVHRYGGGLVDEIDLVIESTRPEDAFAAINAMHDLYVQVPSPWFKWSRSAENAGEEHR